MKITLENIKNIKKLEFTLPASGVWLLTGVNGSGKSSLLAAIYRIGAAHAFQRYYRSSTNIKLDNFTSASISYEIPEKNISVTYRYGGERWRPTPSKHSKALAVNSKYPQIVFIEANGQRVEPYPQEITPTRLKDASEEIKNFMISVLENNKWGNLKQVATAKGRGNKKAFLIPRTINTAKSPTYFSEKNFSLGELCILRLASQITQIPNNSLLLIDEIEIALHPKAQYKLLKQLETYSIEKNLTIIFSTHSSSLIKSSQNNRIILIEEIEDKPQEFNCTVGAYPARALGAVAFFEELDYDYLFFTEDMQGKFLLEKILEKYFSETSQRHISYKIIPIGGCVQVIEFLKNSEQIIPQNIKKFAFLDKDVKDEILPKVKKHSVINLFSEFDKKIKYLPCTPELGIQEILHPTIQISPKNNFSKEKINQAIMLSGVNFSIIKPKKSDMRNHSKNEVKKLVEKIKERHGVEENDSYKYLYESYVNMKYSSPVELKKLLNPIFNSL